jgi:hypothetical protein
MQVAIEWDAHRFPNQAGAAPMLRTLTTHFPLFTFCSEMSTATHTPPAPPLPLAPATPAPEWARALLERQLWILGQLAEGGLEIARAIERQATGEGSEEGAPQVVEAHIPMAYARVARAVRMTILLQSKLIGELQNVEIKAAQESLARSPRAIDRPRLEREQKARIGRIVGRIVWADREDAAESDRQERLAVELLDQDELYGDILTRPVSEIIAHICRDLGLEPDWPQLAEEAWAQAEIKSGAAGGPLAAVMAASWPPPAQERVQLTPQAASP